MHTYEVEIKSLLGSKEQADALRERMRAVDPMHALIDSGTQLNHYFLVEAPRALYNHLAPLFADDERARLRRMLDEGSEFSIRTRQADGTVLFVVKASLDDMTSANGISRIEFESPVALSLDELDRRILGVGGTYQAKWSRAREVYQVHDATVTIDRNAGYGYVAEFERVVHDLEEIPAAREMLHALMMKLGVEELPQDRLARMFAHYNEHWPEYYGTDKIFTIT